MDRVSHVKYPGLKDNEIDMHKIGNGAMNYPVVKIAGAAADDQDKAKQYYPVEPGCYPKMKERLAT